MSRPHPPIKTRCYDCAEPTKRHIGNSTDFYTDDGIVWTCDKDDCDTPEKGKQRIINSFIKRMEETQTKKVV